MTNLDGEQKKNHQLDVSLTGLIDEKLEFDYALHKSFKVSSNIPNLGNDLKDRKMFHLFML